MRGCAPALERQAIAGQHERFGFGRSHDRDQLAGLQLGRVMHQDFGQALDAGIGKHVTSDGAGHRPD